MSFYHGSPERKPFLFVIGALVVLFIIVIASKIFSLPELDNDTFCPKDAKQIPSGELNILIDRTDALTDLNKSIVNQLVSNWLSSAQPFQRMNLYVLKTDDIKEFKKELSVCAPPSEFLLSLARGRNVAKKLLETQKEKIFNAINEGIQSVASINQSRIIESLRQITNSTWTANSKLLVISDLIEISKLANFYHNMAPDFDKWQTVPNAAILNEIMLSKTNHVQICELQTDNPDQAHRGAARVFWQKFFYKYGVVVKASCSEVQI